ncbi:hypothetical protein L596_026741 [Steinernema carpocapsae]|uniref:Uncharacterized protein n=1 Tax=Steinernema carpocapsae TaxID=34508 RepID=A0A4U5M286_STECR|nr:hypothetical protein L596_026741 [Steinernema carpocapsae]
MDSVEYAFLEAVAHLIDVSQWRFLPGHYQGIYNQTRENRVNAEVYIRGNSSNDGTVFDFSFSGVFQGQKLNSVTMALPETKQYAKVFFEARIADCSSAGWSEPPKEFAGFLKCFPRVLVSHLQSDLSKFFLDHQITCLSKVLHVNDYIDYNVIDCVKFQLQRGVIKNFAFNSDSALIDYLLEIFELFFESPYTEKFTFPEDEDLINPILPKLLKMWSDGTYEKSKIVEFRDFPIIVDKKQMEGAGFQWKHELIGNKQTTSIFDLAKPERQLTWTVCYMDSSNVTKKLTFGCL